MNGLLATSAPARSRWRAGAARLLVVALIGAAVFGVQRKLMDDGAHPVGRAQRVTLVSSPRPAPAPKPVEKPPEVRIEKTEIAIRHEAPAQGPPPDPHLGVDSAAEGAGDGFGLVAKRGGRDITTLGDDRGSGGVAIGTPQATPSAAQQFGYVAYAGLVRQRLQNDLQTARELRDRNYASVVHLWIDAGGRIERVELQQSSGFADVDLALRRAFTALPRLPEPPTGLPQPLRLRVTSREIGGQS